MNMQSAVVIHAIAHRAGKTPLFFSRSIFDRMKARGNTHYCFLCEGRWGFAPDEHGVATNQMDDVVLLETEWGALITVQAALENDYLGKRLVVENELSDRWLLDGNWLGEYVKQYARFQDTSELDAWCDQNGYRIRRHDPMERHDPKTHAGAVVGDADKFDSVDDWLSEKLPPYFPFLVAIM